MENQVKDMAEQMQALDEFVTRARTQNGRHHDSHLDNLQHLTANASQSYSNVRDHYSALGDRVSHFQADASDMCDDIQNSVHPLTEDVRQPLKELRNCIEQAPLKEYTPTGQTPERTQYDYSISLPRTQTHETLLARMRNPNEDSADPDTPVKPVIDSPAVSPTSSPIKTMVYNDAENEVVSPRPPTTEVLKPTPSNMGLREVDLNVIAAKPPVSNSNTELSPAPSSPSTDASDTEIGSNSLKQNDDMSPPPAKKQRSIAPPAAAATGFTESKLPQKRNTRRTAMMDGRENIPPSIQTRSRGPSGRRLRNSPP